MQSATKSLNEWVRELAKDDEKVYQDWIEQITGKPNYIKSIEDLMKLASGNRWESFLNKIESDILAEYLDDWKRDMLGKKDQERKCIIFAEIKSYSFD